jgi:hypothetical protein
MMEFKLYGLPNNVAHACGFRGKDEDTVELNAVFLADAMFRYG